MKWYHYPLVLAVALQVLLSSTVETVEAVSPYAECRKMQALDIELQEKRLIAGLKVPSSYTVVSRAGYKNEHHITFTATNTYGGLVETTARLPLTNCVTGY